MGNVDTYLLLLSPEQSIPTCILYTPQRYQWDETPVVIIETSFYKPPLKLLSASSLPHYYDIFCSCLLGSIPKINYLHTNLPLRFCLLREIQCKTLFQRFTKHVDMKKNQTNFTSNQEVAQIAWVQAQGLLVTSCQTLANYFNSSCPGFHTCKISVKLMPAL